MTTANMSESFESPSISFSKSGESVASRSVPSRERVSAAIALVRARQASVNKSSVTTIEDVDSLRRMKLSKSQSHQQSSMNSTSVSGPGRKNFTGNPLSTANLSGSHSLETSAYSSSRSPLAPVEQQQESLESKSRTTTTPTSGGSKSGSFFQNLFSSRSEVKGSSSSRALPTVPSGSHEEKTVENNAPDGSQSYSTSVYTGQTTQQSGSLAQSKSVPSKSTSSETTRVVKPSANASSTGKARQAVEQALSFSSADSDSDVPTVDAKTMQDVSRFLDSLSLKTPQTKPSSNETAEKTEAHDDVDPIDMLRRQLSGGASYESETDEEESSVGAVNHETLAAIEAFIDKVAQTPGGDSTDDLVSLISSKAPPAESAKSVAKSDAPTFEDPSVGTTSRTSVNDTVGDEESLLQSKSSDSNILEQVRTSKPSPIYERLETVEKGSCKDPPAEAPFTGPQKVDPPSNAAGDLSEAVMRMHEEDVAPSYSVESLGSGPTINVDNPVGLVEEEKKDGDEDDLEVSTPTDTKDDTYSSEPILHKEGDEDGTDTQVPYVAEIGKSLSPVMEASSTDSAEVVGIQSNDSNISFNIKAIEGTDDEDNDIDRAMEGEIAQVSSGDTSVDGINYDDLLLQALGTSDALSPRGDQEKKDLATAESVDESTEASEKVDDQLSVDRVEQARADFSVASESSHGRDAIESARSRDESVELANVPVTKKKPPVDPPMAGVEHTYDEFTMSKTTDSAESGDSRGVERYAILEETGSNDETPEEVTAEDGSNGPDLKDDDQEDISADRDEFESDVVMPFEQNAKNAPDYSDPTTWKLKDIASEETEKAAGRTRPRITGPMARARVIKSLLSDDTSVGQSCTTNTGGEEQEENPAIKEELPQSRNTKATGDVVVFEEEDGVEMMETSFIAEKIDMDDDSEDDDDEDSEPKVSEVGDENASRKPEADEAIPMFDPSEDESEVEDAASEADEKKPDPDGSLNGDGTKASELDPEGRLETTTDDYDDDDFVGEFLRQGSVDREDEVEDESLMNKRSEVSQVESVVSVQPSVTATESAASVVNENVEGRLGNLLSNSSSYDDVEEEESRDFMEQFDELGVEDDDAKEDNVDTDPPKSRDLVVQTDLSLDHDNKYAALGGLASPVDFAKYFASLDEGMHADDNQTDLVRHFQKLIAPVVSGKKPSIIETARIRQAAKKAKVPLSVVDKYLENVEDDYPTTIPANASSDSGGGNDKDMSRYEDIEDLNEDDAIAAFLSRFGALKSGGHFVKANESSADDKLQKGSEMYEEEAVEIDATFGYVKRELAPEEEEDEWWKDAAPTPRQNNEGRARRAHESNDDDGDDENSDSEGWQNPARTSSQDTVEDNLNESVPKAATDDKSNPGHKKKQSKKNLALAVETEMPDKTYGYDSRTDRGTWLRRQAMASYGKGWEKHSAWLSPRAAGGFSEPEPIDGVEAAQNLGKFLLGKRLFPSKRPWKLAYKERTKAHPGYFSIDVFSIYESASVGVDVAHDLDYTPWEHREVKQRFFHERSISFSRNWFGSLHRSRGNQKYKPPFCKPKSMEMPIENIPDPGEWTEEWYTTWKSPLDQMGGPQISQSRSSMDYTEEGSFSTDEDESYTDQGSGSFTDASSADPMSRVESTFSGSRGTEEGGDDDDETWEEAPECGTIVNVKQKIGERVSRVHPDYTSSLRRSRWRKKYFPRGTFPY